MSTRTLTQTASLYRTRQYQLREEARRLRAIKRWCAGVLALDIALAMGYLFFKEDLISLIHATL